jgi:hypothetical protein
LEDPVVDLSAGVMCGLAQPQPALNSFVNCKNEFGGKKIAQRDLILEDLFVSSNHGE